MKLVIFLIAIACLQVSASAVAQKITLNEKDAPLEKVFTDIKNQTNYNFFYEHNILNGSSNVTINVKDANIQDVLNLCLANQPLVYTIAGNNIGVKKKQAETIQRASLQPPTDITGQVLDSKGIPLVNATVLIKRTKTGTLTDVKGNFTLHNVLPSDLITVTYIGYKPLEVSVGNNTVFNLVMKEATNSLDAVVVQAYGETSQRLNTGDIATVTAKEIADQPVMNALTALQGKIPGLVVQQTSGYASAPFTVELRGRSQLDPTRPSEPLYIIDGVPLTTLISGINEGYSTGSAGVTQNGLTGPANGQSPIFSINPNDIASITVLKDADATAIYGSRGANGVIIINTKTGQAGKTRLEANTYEGLSFVTNHYDLLNTQQYVSMREEAFKNDGITPNSSVFSAYDLDSWNTSRYTDFQKLLWGHTGKQSDAQLTISGGDKLTTFRLAGEYHRETDITTFSGSNQRASVQFNLTHKSLDQRLNISFTSFYSYASVNLVQLPSDVLLPPDAPAVFNPNGTLNWAGWAPISNPFSSLLQPYNSPTNFLNSSLNINYQIITGLTASAKIGYSNSHNTQTFIDPISTLDPQYHLTGQAQFGSNDNSNAIIEPLVEYKHSISKGTFDALIGGTFQSVVQTGTILVGDGYINDNLLYSIANAPRVTASDNSAEYKYIAAFFRLNYNWADEFIVNLSGRRDGSSRFGPGKQFGNFGAVGGAWIFTQEDFFKDNLTFLSFGKIRGSYGITGSDNLGDYQYLSNWATGIASSYVQGQTAYIPENLANPNLQWQVNKKLEGALDLGFLKDRITLDFSWYRDLVGNELVSAPLPNQTGFSNVEENLPATIQNTGVEGTLNAKILDGQNFKWSLNFDIGANRNKLLSFPGLAQSNYAYQFIVGQPLSIAKVLHYTGIDPLTGQYTFEDKNHDGIINVNPTDPKNDLYPVNLAVRSEGGFGSNFKYKNWSLNVFFRFQVQTLPSSFTNIAAPGSNGNIPEVVFLNHWQKPGDNAEFSRLTTQPTASDSYFEVYSDAGYVNGSYIRLQNLALYYDFPSQWLKNLGIQTCRLSVQGENLLLLTKYPGVDPDTPYYGTLPPSRYLEFGLHFTL